MIKCHFSEKSKMNNTFLETFMVAIMKSRYSEPVATSTGKQHIQFQVKDVQQILEYAQEDFKQEPTLLNLSSEITIVGDLHGNINDLLRIFTECGYPPKTRYLFLGDYVDRGENSLEVFLLLVSLKLRYPDCIYMLRGNHETEVLTTGYGFKSEVVRRLKPSVYTMFLDTFHYLPIAAVVDNKIFCVHAGIARDVKRLSQIAELEKTYSIATEGIIADLLWSDPAKSKNAEDFAKTERGAGAKFGPNPLIKFLEKNGLEMLVRSHETCDKGFMWAFEKSKNATKKCLTIFSSSNYMNIANTAAVLHVIDGEEPQIITFKPRRIPDFQYPDWAEKYGPLPSKSDYYDDEEEEDESENL